MTSDADKREFIRQGRQNKKSSNEFKLADALDTEMVELEKTKLKQAEVIEFAFDNGGFDGGHHKMWVIDQMIRMLTGCPVVKKKAFDYNNESYEYEALGESEEYKRLVKESCDGEDSLNTYSWDVGIPP